MLAASVRALRAQTRSFSATVSLADRFAEKVPQWQAETKEFKAKYGDKVLHEVTVNHALGGMRGIQGLITETSNLDAEEGIRFRGYTIPECQKLLPKAKGGEEPLPEGIFWLLMTGEIPTEAEVAKLTEELHTRSKLPCHVTKVIDALPKDMHPMTQFCQAILALQT
ncbi:MAG: hypothetical protein MHM6MM_004977, partial [Cercozoa sp. M6MM]